MRYCDHCGTIASYRIDENDLCRKCADQYMDESWNDLSVSEKAESLDVYCRPFT